MERGRELLHGNVKRALERAVYAPTISWHTYESATPFEEHLFSVVILLAKLWFSV